MREILFRAKRTDNGEWVYGDFVHNVRIKDETTPLISAIILTERNGAFPVKDETVGQFTGRTAQCTDKIFEGDKCVVTTFDHNGEDYQHECVVEWDDGTLAFVNEKREFWMPIACVEDTNSDVEVIGNIHDKTE